MDHPVFSQIHKYQVQELTNKIEPELDVARRRLLEVHPAPVGPCVLKQELEVRKWIKTDFGATSSGCPKSWVGLTLISVFHHLAQLPSRFCQIPITPSRVGQTVEHSKSKSTKPSLSSLGTTCNVHSLSVELVKDSKLLQNLN